MILNTLFDNIYVINLEKSVDRKNHIIKEFNRVGIEKYEFFNAVKNDSEQVKELINSNIKGRFLFVVNLILLAFWKKSSYFNSPECFANHGTEFASGLCKKTLKLSVNDSSEFI